MSRLVLIDRDGTINVEKHYLSSPDQIELLPSAAEGIKLLNDLDLRVVIITNQSAIGRGFFDAERLDHIHDRLRQQLGEAGAGINGIYFCPHTPEDNCQCRKPLAEMAHRASRDFGLELSGSFVIGDKDCDIELGQNIGAATILVRTGYGGQTEEAGLTKPDYVVDNLYEAACRIKNVLEAFKSENLTDQSD